MQETYRTRSVNALSLVSLSEKPRKRFHTAVSHSRASMHRANRRSLPLSLSCCRIHEFAAPILNHSMPRTLWGVGNEERRERRTRQGSGTGRGLPIKQCSHICQPLLLPLPFSSRPFKPLIIPPPCSRTAIAHDCIMRPDHLGTHGTKGEMPL